MAMTETKRRKAKKPHISKGAQERFVETDEAIRLLDPETRRQKKNALKRDRKNLARITPTGWGSPWFDAHWEHGQPFPPGMDETKMRMCRDCDRYIPPQCISSHDVCLDCQHDHMSEAELEALPSSCSRIDLAKMKASAKAGRQYTGGF